MKHAGAATLLRLAPLLQALRELPGLIERTPGSFYRRSRACLHFHEHGEQVFADVRIDGPEFTRVDVSDAAAQARLLTDLRRRLP